MLELFFKTFLLPSLDSARKMLSNLYIKPSYGSVVLRKYCQISTCVRQFVAYLNGIAGLVVWSLASGAQVPRINIWLGHSRFG